SFTCTSNWATRKPLRAGRRATRPATATVRPGINQGWPNLSARPSFSLASCARGRGPRPHSCEGARFSLASLAINNHWQNERRRGGEAMAGVDRRSALAATRSGMAGMLAAGQPPAYAQATTVHWLTGGLRQMVRLPEGLLGRDRRPTGRSTTQVVGRRPIMLPYRQAARSGRFEGYQGPSTSKAAGVVTQYLIVDSSHKTNPGCTPTHTS